MATRKSLLDDGTSEAIKKPQPSKDMNGGSAKIDGANPSSPSTNNATRREQYNNYVKTLNKADATKLYNTVSNYKEMGLTDDQIYENVLNSANIKAPEIKTPKNGVDLTIKGNFDLYNPVDWQNQPEIMQQYYVQANNDMKASRRALSQLMLQQDALSSRSSNVNQVTTLIDAVENAYDRGVFDTQTIANTLGVDANIISLIQQGKANELVTLDQEYVQEQLRPYFRAEEDYDINLQRTMEDYQLAKTNLDTQYNSAMQTLKRNLFDDKRQASVGSAVAGISGSEYAVRVIEAKHQQNMDDLENNYIYSSLNQKYQYTRAIEDYNKNIQRLSEDFDDSLKNIQASVLQQFQEIDNKIGLTTAQLAQAYGTLQQNVATAKASAVTDYMKALSDGENMLADAIANAYGLDTGDLTTHKFTSQELNLSGFANSGQAINSLGNILASNDGLRIGTFTKLVNGKPYTYNVYATREDGIAAARQLLHGSRYRGKTMREIAKTWTGNQNPATARAVMQEEGLNLDEKLTEDNIEKLLVSIGRREGTMKKGQTLEQRASQGQDLSSYGTKPTAGGGEEAGAGTSGRYQESDNGMYESYLTGKDWTSAKIASVKNDPTYGKTEEERWKNFKAAANSYQAVKAKGSIQGIQERLDTVVEFKNKYNELNDKEREELRYAEVLDEHGLIKTAGLSERALNVANLYNQIKGQLFINGIIDSKSQGAAYGNLSDAEGNRISQAASAMNLNSPSYLGSHVNYLINNLSSNIKELGGKPDYTSGYNFTIDSGTGKRAITIQPNTKGYLDAVANLYGNSDINLDESITGERTPTPSDRQFNITGGTVEIEQTTMK